MGQDALVSKTFINSNGYQESMRVRNLDALSNSLETFIEEYNKSKEEITSSHEDAAANIFNENDPLINTIQKDADNIKNILSNIKDDSFEYSLANLVAHIEEIQERTIETVANLHKQELDKTPANIKQALEESQKTQKDNLEKSLSKTLESLKKDLELERNRVRFLAGLYNNQEEVRKVIDELYKKHAGEGDGGIELEFANNGQVSAIFKDPNLIQTLIERDALKTLHGRQIKKLANGDYTMTMPARTFNAGYYWNSLEMREDMLSLAVAIRASGHDSIYMNVKHSNPKHAANLAREAYYACRLAGYDPKTITIKVNGQEQKIEELFKGNQSLLQEIETKADQRKSIVESPSKEGKAEVFRKRLQEFTSNNNPDSETNPDSSPGPNH